MISSGNKLHIFDGATFELSWRSQELGSDLGSYNHLVVKDFDGDNKKEVVIGAKNMLYQFE